MKTCQIKLTSIQDVREFMEIVTRCDFEIDLCSGRYVVDAKSIMGIFSLDITKPIDLNIHASEGVDEIIKKLAPYIIE